MKTININFLTIAAFLLIASCVLITPTRAGEYLFDLAQEFGADTVGAALFAIFKVFDLEGILYRDMELEVSEECLTKNYNLDLLAYGHLVFIATPIDEDIDKCPAFLFDSTWGQYGDTSAYDSVDDGDSAFDFTHGGEDHNNTKIATKEALMSSDPFLFELVDEAQTYPILGFQGSLRDLFEAYNKSQAESHPGKGYDLILNNCGGFILNFASHLCIQIDEGMITYVVDKLVDKIPSWYYNANIFGNENFYLLNVPINPNYDPYYCELYYPYYDPYYCDLYHFLPEMTSLNQEGTIFRENHNSRRREQRSNDLQKDDLFGPIDINHRLLIDATVREYIRRNYHYNDCYNEDGEIEGPVKTSHIDELASSVDYDGASPSIDDDDDTDRISSSSSSSSKKSSKRRNSNSKKLSSSDEEEEKDAILIFEFGDFNDNNDIIQFDNGGIVPKKQQPIGKHSVGVVDDLTFGDDIPKFSNEDGYDHDGKTKKKKGAKTHRSRRRKGRSYLRH